MRIFTCLFDLHKICYTGTQCFECTCELVSWCVDLSFIKPVQGVRKWNVFFESVPVAKLLDILTGSDAF